MASDPELPRFAGPSCHWQKAGQSRIDLPRKAARSSAASQHLLEEVLHFFCELRGPITTGRRVWRADGVSSLRKEAAVAMGPCSRPGRRDGNTAIVSPPPAPAW